MKEMVISKKFASSDDQALHMASYKSVFHLTITIEIVKICKLPTKTVKFFLCIDFDQYRLNSQLFYTMNRML